MNATATQPAGYDEGQFHTNPFATRWTRPGAIPYVFCDRMTIDDVVRRLRERGWRGAIVGPHGSGKSTLLATLLPAIEAAGRRAVVVHLHDGQRRLPLSRGERKRLDASSLLVIDGYEQLSHWRRRWLAVQCGAKQSGLLITSHDACGLPPLVSTAPTLDLVERLIELDLPPHQGRIDRADIRRAWHRHPTNIREVFFDLYDLFEARSRGIGSVLLSAMTRNTPNGL